MSEDKPTDPLEFFKTFWNQSGFPLPGFAMPTMDIKELDKRISDFRAVEGWLNLNLNMLQITIQGLEVQRATLAAMQSTMRESSDTASDSNPLVNPALWPWNMSKNTEATGAPPSQDKPKRRRDSGKNRDKS